MNSIILYLTKDGTVMFYQDKSNILGFSKEEVVGKKWFNKFIEMEEKIEIEELFNSVLIDDFKYKRHTNNVRTKNDKYKRINFLNDRLEIAGGEIVIKSEGWEE